MTGRAAPLPMFPLGTVLFPHAPLPLHVFEPRYRALAHDVVAGEGEFGVVLIERGSEVGGGDTRTALGTLATVAEAHELDDGRWAILAVGARRIRVRSWLADDPYPRARVEEVAEGPWPADGAALVDMIARGVRRSLALRAELGEPAAPVTVELDPDPRIAAWQLAFLGPLGAYDRQRVLAVDDPRERLVLLGELVADANVLLATRAAGG
ncbi:MAG TPA: LON peptidase substrate-binding domain-containing protein [Acidimicrobiales bacterium]|nr:LON peptidase substrate-binding domain-containing protein [Acidimicrobiales bacterium]